ncbi:DUF58 domain-containing protein [Oceanospirillum sediminis]|uniref:DUF58 domain-containing protein n=1 Tax=Oceanospirillum sediminis TaxID=2760088 RepID=A0A839IKU7_9GAMM|nr:DUF58 domain-containing protein [Oceanospirillum sediminis]MBB1485330.1 DUF58 domain-containing protein [Oceanospirillum sediminis]
MWSLFRISSDADKSYQSTSEQALLPELTLEHLLGWQRYKGALKSKLHTPTSSVLAGQHRSRVQGKGMELSEIRNYQPGDDIRLMDWKVTARTRKPHTKVFMEEKERPVQLVLDLSYSMLFGSQRSKAEQAANVAATIGWALSHQGDRCGGLIFNGKKQYLIRPGARKKGLLPLLKQSCDLSTDLITEHSASAPGRMNQVLKQISLPGHGQLIILISDFWSLDITDNQLLSRLSKKHNVLAVLITDPMESELPPGPCYLHDKQKSFFFDGSLTDDRTRYKKQAEQRQQALKQFFMQNKSHFITLSTEENPPDKLQQCFI